VQHHVSCLPLERPMQPVSIGTLYDSASILFSISMMSR